VARLSTRLVLASASPRRRELLETLRLPFVVSPSDVPERRAAGEQPVDYARRLAASKASAVAEVQPAGTVVLGADTLVVCDAGTGAVVLEKPRDRGDARRMIALLSGRSHDVVTALALVRAPMGQAAIRHVVTRVVFRALDDREIDGYVASGEGDDKAGAYAVQGLGAGLVARVEGSYTNVVGLPVAELIEMLREQRVLEEWP
jgi:septum formation protein